MPLEWHELSPPSSPPGIFGPVAERDLDTDEIIYVGPRASPFTGEILTWSWDGTTWTEIVTVTPPTVTPREIGWDGVNSRMMLLADGWRYFYLDRGIPQWIEIFPATTVTTSNTASAAWVWLPTAGALGFYAIDGGGGSLWLWDGTDWTDTGIQITTGGSPNNINYENIVRDPVRDVAVEYGGNANTSPSFLTTSELDSAVTAFTEIPTANNPGPAGLFKARFMAWLGCAGAMAVFPNNHDIWLYQDVGGGTYDWLAQGIGVYPFPPTGDVRLVSEPSGTVMMAARRSSSGPTETWRLVCVHPQPQVMRWW